MRNLFIDARDGGLLYKAPCVKSVYFLCSKFWVLCGPNALFLTAEKCLKKIKQHQTNVFGFVLCAFVILYVYLFTV